MSRLEVTNEYLKTICYDEIGLWGQNVNTVLGSIINKFERVCRIVER